MKVEYVTDTSKWEKWQRDYRLGLILIPSPLGSRLNIQQRACRRLVGRKRGVGLDTLLLPCDRDGHGRVLHAAHGDTGADAPCATGPLRTTPLAIPSAPSVVSVPSIPLPFVTAAAAFAPPAFAQEP